MKQEDKELLLKDLCSRLPYGVKINCFGIPKKLLSISIDDGFITLEVSGGHFYYPFSNELHNECLPYLRPLSSMTEGEIKEYKHLVAFSGSSYGAVALVDWLNAHHFDYRRLIEKGLALPAPEDMYNLI